MEQKEIAKLVAQAAECQAEIDLCDKRIDFLTVLANVLLKEPEIKYIDLIAVTRPINGARPITFPLVPQRASSGQMFSFLNFDQPLPNPDRKIGFQHFYDPVELGNEEIFDMGMTLESSMAIAMAQFLITRLKQRKQKLLADIDEIFRK
jgi:hypothetical protein